MANDKEKALLIGIQKEKESREEALYSLNELAELADTAGARVCDQVFQHIKNIHPAYFIGEGKTKEIKDKIASEKPDVVLIDHELSPAQQNNLENFWETKVIDRTGLILDIFAKRAQSREGKLQVELAQLNYLLPRLTGKGISMSRLGGGIGTRGPGETKLEYDRRKIRDRIGLLKKEIHSLKQTRDMHRQRRHEEPVPIVTIVGYTNAGKSTLLNKLTQANVLAENKLFATLDPTTRQLKLPNQQKILLTDTVGFIKKLPTQLIEAFKATLEEVKEADLLLHVIDLSQSNFEEQAHEVLKILDEMEVRKPILHVYNKIDAVSEKHVFLHHERLHPFCMISAEKKLNLDGLLMKIQDLLSHFVEIIQLKIPLEDQKVVSTLYEKGMVLEKKYFKRSIHIKAQVNKKMASQLKKMYGNL